MMNILVLVKKFGAIQQGLATSTTNRTSSSFASVTHLFDGGGDRISLKANFSINSCQYGILAAMKTTHRLIINQAETWILASMKMSRRFWLSENVFKYQKWNSAVLSTEWERIGKFPPKCQSHIWYGIYQCFEEPKG